MRQLIAYFAVTVLPFVLSAALIKGLKLPTPSCFRPGVVPIIKVNVDICAPVFRLMRVDDDFEIKKEVGPGFQGAHWEVFECPCHIQLNASMPSVTSSISVRDVLERATQILTECTVLDYGGTASMDEEPFGLWTTVYGYPPDVHHGISSNKTYSVATTWKSNNETS